MVAVLSSCSCPAPGHAPWPHPLVSCAAPPPPHWSWSRALPRLPPPPTSSTRTLVWRPPWQEAEQGVQGAQELHRHSSPGRASARGQGGWPPHGRASSAPPSQPRPPPPPVVALQH